MRTNYSSSFKSAVMEKALHRGQGVTMAEIARECGVDKSSISRRIRGSRAPAKGELMGMRDQDKRPRDWSRAERLQALLSCHGMGEEERNGWYRAHGIYLHHLRQWEHDFGTGNAEDGDGIRRQNKQLKEENRQLQWELRRKEQALAETAAMLVLKKKWTIFWDAAGTTDHAGAASRSDGMGRGGLSAGRAQGGGLCGVGIIGAHLTALGAGPEPTGRTTGREPDAGQPAE